MGPDLVLYALGNDRMTDESKRTKKSDNAEEPIKLEIQHKGSPSRTDSAARLTPGVRSESTDSARPISTTSKGDAISEGATSSTARRRKKEKALPPGAHRVNLTVHISLAIPAGKCVILLPNKICPGWYMYPLAYITSRLLLYEIEALHIYTCAGRVYVINLINRGKYARSIVIIKHKYMLICNHKYCCRPILSNTTRNMSMTFTL